MKNKLIPFFVFVLMVLACTLSGQIDVTPSPIASTSGPAAATLRSAASTEAVHSISPTPTLTPTPTQPPPTPTLTLTPVPTQPPPTPTPTLIPSDLPFTIDCSALDASRQADCDAFIAATRDQVYPILKDVTGVSLAKCYPNMQYIILPTDPSAGAGGESGGHKITYNKQYSIDLRHRYDVHEILHSISTCAKALDDHVFHGLIMNYVYDQLGVHDAGFFTSKENVNENLDFLFKAIKTSSGSDFNSQCRGIFQRKITLLFFEKGDKATIQQLYRSTIGAKPAASPSAKLVSIWGSEARQVQALLETLDKEYQYHLNVPECGY